jgi:hypothetical protein
MLKINDRMLNERVMLQLYISEFSLQYRRTDSFFQRVWTITDWTTQLPLQQGLDLGIQGYLLPFGIGNHGSGRVCTNLGNLPRLEDRPLESSLSSVVCMLVLIYPLFELPRQVRAHDYCYIHRFHHRASSLYLASRTAPHRSQYKPNTENVFGRHGIDRPHL